MISTNIHGKLPTARLLCSVSDCAFRTSSLRQWSVDARPQTPKGYPREHARRSFFLIPASLYWLGVGTYQEVIMDNFLRRGGLEVPESVRRFLQGESDPSLRIEQYQEGDTLVVRMDLPGIDPETDVDLSVADDTLHIQARREENAERMDKKGYRSELRYGERSRSIPVPRGVSQAGILATYEDGVLEIRIQLPEQSESQTTKIRVVRTGSHEAHQSPAEPEN